jgi:hypothetical protein
MEVNGLFQVPAALPPGKEPRQPLDRRLDGPQRRSGHFGEEKNPLPLPGIELFVVQPVPRRYTVGT